MAANTTTNLYGSVQKLNNARVIKAQKQEVYGLKYPLGSAKDGTILKKSSGINMIRDAVEQLLLTERGERLMLPDFGCNLRKYVFQPLDETTFQSIRREIEVSFRKYIVGASITKLSVFPTGDFGPAGGNSLRVILNIKLDESDLEVFDVGVTIS